MPERGSQATRQRRAKEVRGAPLRQLVFVSWPCFFRICTSCANQECFSTVNRRCECWIEELDAEILTRHLNHQTLSKFLGDAGKKERKDKKQETRAIWTFGSCMKSKITPWKHQSHPGAWYSTARKVQYSLRVSSQEACSCSLLFSSFHRSRPFFFRFIPSFPFSCIPRGFSFALFLFACFLIFFSLLDESYPFCIL